jgi:uncharacterized protein
MIHRLAAPLIAAFGVLVVLALPAAAHVTVSSDNATRGGYATITIRVPNEESDADTVGVKIQLPTDHPIANVSVQPKPGWTFKTTTKKLENPIRTDDGSIDEAVSEIEWTGGRIAPGEFDQFLIQAGPLPTDTDALTFKAIQTYRDSAGKTSEVAWIEQSGPGQAEPEHPAPVLKLTSASAGDSGTDAAAATSQTAPGPSVTAADGAPSSNPPAKTSSSNSALHVFAMAFGAAGLVMAIIALVLAAAARQKLSMLERDDVDRPDAQS